MLKQRIFTALLLIPIFIFLVIELPPIAFCILTGLFVILGAWEWSYFMGVKKFGRSLIYPGVLTLLMILALAVPVTTVLFMAVGWWLIALLLVVSYPKTKVLWSKSIIWRSLMGALVLVPCWLAVNYIRNAPNGIYVLLFLFVLIWGADIGAYFVGRAWGKRKLAPAVSPGKSWEGLAGALVATLLIALVALVSFKVPYFMWLYALLLVIVTVLFSVLGDLFESMLKRNAGLKDSGRLLPGHGGVLDRIDSLTAAAPVFTVGAMLLGRIFH